MTGIAEGTIYYRKVSGRGPAAREKGESEMRTDGYGGYGKSFPRDCRALQTDGDRQRGDRLCGDRRYCGRQYEDRQLGDRQCEDRLLSDRQYSERQPGDRRSGQWEAEESEAYRELKAQLTEYYRKGVKVSLGGVRMPVSKIARICAVREEGKYMGDYIVDESGELTEVRFDRVSR